MREPLAKIKYAGWLLALSLAASKAQATNPMPDQRVNLREACRRIAAGAYLNAFDAKTQAEQSIEQLKRSLAKLREGLKEADADFQRKRAAADSERFDVTKATDQTAAANKASSFRRTIDEFETLLKESQTRLARASDEEKELRSRLGTVFSIQYLREEPGKGYPIRVDYLSECPKYRFLCPLPREHAAALIRIFPEEDMSQPCRRYAALK